MKRWTDKEKKSIARSLKKYSSAPNENGCILWTGRTRYGYGWMARRKKELRAHRAAWIVANGEIPKGMCVCHKCDVRNCINVDHLWLGTQRENIADMVMKKRNKWTISNGESNGNHKLTQSQVDEMRCRYANGGISQRMLANEYGVACSLICVIVNNKAWKGSLA